MSELKACPFCGSNDLEVESQPSISGEYKWIRCKTCSARGGSFLNQEPYQYWNTRSLEDDLRSKLGAAKEALFPIIGRNNRPDADDARKAMTILEN